MGFTSLFKEQETLFIILTQKVDSESVPEVEFSPGGVASTRVPGTVENEFTISVTAPGKYSSRGSCDFQLLPELLVECKMLKTLLYFPVLM